MDSLISLLLVVGLFYLMMKYGCGAHARRGGCGHYQHKTGQETITEETTNVKGITRDPVCGIDIAINRACDSVEYGRETYYFCSKDCLRKFKERPEYFAEIDRMERRYIA
jgi:YHS domain-containing protein